MAESRIYFIDNPYPKGHLIKEFKWSAHLYGDGLFFHFHLKTDRYYAEDDSYDSEDEEPESSWKSYGVWSNYHACRLSSNQWDGDGIIVGNEQKQIDFKALDKLILTADTLPRPENFDYDDAPFSIYLLGHDDCANHKIHLKKNAQNTFDIEWTGKIALAYVGDYDFKYDFKASIYNVTFEGIYYNKDHFSEEEAQALLAKYAVNFEGVSLNPEI